MQSNCRIAGQPLRTTTGDQPVIVRHVYPGSPTNLRNLVETGSHFHMANSASLPVPIPKRIARTKAFVWASHVRPIPA